MVARNTMSSIPKYNRLLCGIADIKVDSSSVSKFPTAVLSAVSMSNFDPSGTSISKTDFSAKSVSAILLGIKPKATDVVLQQDSKVPEDCLTDWSNAGVHTT